MKITIKDFNINNFSIFLKSAKAKGASHPIEISGGKIYTKATTASTSFAKYTAVDAEIIGDFSGLDSEKTYVFYLLDLEKMQKVVEVLKDSKDVKVEMEYLAEPNEDRFMVSHMRFISDDAKLKIKTKEKSLVVYMKQESWLVVSNVDDYFLKFDLDKVDMSRLKSLLDFGNAGADSKNADKSIILRYNSDDKSICFTSKQKDAWNMDLKNNPLVNETMVETKAFKFIVSHLDLLEKDSLYSCYLKNMRGNWCMVIESNANNKVFAGLITHDDNEAETI